MALVRFPLEKYASLELNQVAFPKTGMVISQTPLGEYFTVNKPCENGMWVSANKGNEVIKPLAATTEVPVGIVYTAEKEYDYAAIGLKNFGRKIKGDYPRVGILSLGDTVTTNCVQFDTTEFAAVTDPETSEVTYPSLWQALEALDATHPLYVVAVANDAVPKLTATKPGTGICGQVTKYYTVPNGEKGIKYEIIRL